MNFINDVEAKRLLDACGGDIQELAKASQPELSSLRSRLTWLSKARPNQLYPAGDPNLPFDIWMILAGRGWGKTRVGAEKVFDWAWTDPGIIVHVVAATAGDLRRTIFEGVSGLCAVIPAICIAKYNSSTFEMTLVNGSKIIGFSAEEPSRLRGPQCHKAWADELAAWTYKDAWDQMMFGLRLGNNTQCIITTTPQPTELVRNLLKRKDVVVTRGSTYENKDNLSATFLKELAEQYENTRLGRQEIYAEVLDDVVGALWSYKTIDSTRVIETPDITRIVIGVDPAVTSNANSDETGIIVCGLGRDGRGYVLADLSIKGSPDQWARRIKRAWEVYQPNYVAIETNNGGDIVPKMMQLIAPEVVVKQVKATKGKTTRAEPVSMLYEQGRISHMGIFKELEDQMCTFTPSTKTSPDRMDALVWAFTELFGKQHLEHEPGVILVPR